MAHRTSELPKDTNVDVIKINKHRPDWFSGLIIHGCLEEDARRTSESEACVPSLVICQDYCAARRLMSNIITTLMRYGVNQREFLRSCYRKHAVKASLSIIFRCIDIDKCALKSTNENCRQTELCSTWRPLTWLSRARGSPEHDEGKIAFTTKPSHRWWSTVSRPANNGADLSGLTAEYDKSFNAKSNVGADGSEGNAGDLWCWLWVEVKVIGRRKVISNW